MVLEVVNANIPSVIGGSADLTPSTLTKTKNDPDISPGHYSGRYIHYGIREHAMVAALSGMALHGGVIPYSGTFFVFSDYCRPSIRLAALMKQRVVYVMTHDSIGLGEDGPTHQPVEHLAALRAMPNLLVMRPADAVETAEVWELALNQTERPTILALSRQNLATLRDQHTDENRSGHGAYVLRESEGPAQVTFLATGSEVEIAVAARDILQRQNIGARVVSMPCWELFDQQDAAYRAGVLDSASVKVGIEAASPFGWERYLGRGGAFIGLDHFGASAPYKELYKAFGITADAAAEAALALLRKKANKKD
jgi:transketolase